jgi:hypothetical protein
VPQLAPAPGAAFFPSTPKVRMSIYYFILRMGVTDEHDCEMVLLFFSILQYINASRDAPKGWVSDLFA